MTGQALQQLQIPEPWWWVLVGACVLALCMPRRRPWSLRVLTALLLGGLLWASRGPSSEVLHLGQSRPLLLTQVPIPAAELPAWQEGLPAGTQMQVAAAGLATEVALQRMAGREPGDLGLAWVARAAPVQGVGGLDLPALSRHPVLGLDPRQLRLRSLRPAQVGRPVTLEVDLPARLPPGLQLQLTVSQSGEERARCSWRPGEQRAELRFEPEEPGRYDCQLRLQLPGGVIVARTQLAVAAPPPRYLIGRGAALLQAALRVQGVETRVAGDMPAELKGVLLLLDPLSPTAQRRVRDFVTEGGGVLLCGAADGGALPRAGAPLAALSPLRLLSPPPARPPGPRPEGKPAERPGHPRPRPDQPPPATQKPPEAKGRPATGATGKPSRIEEREVQVRRIAMVMLVDRSASMREKVAAGQTRMDLCRASLAATIQDLDPGDELAVLTFGDVGVVHEVLGLTNVAESGRIHRALAGLRASQEGTSVLAALRRARRMLAQSKAAVKHVVVITDGVIRGVGGEVMGRAEEVQAAAIRTAGATLSLLRVGQDDQEPLGAAQALDRIARAGGGRAIRQKDFGMVPKLVSLEVESLRSKLGRERRDSAPQQPGKAPPDLRPSEPDQPPPRLRAEPPPPPAEIPVYIIEESTLLAPKTEAALPSLGGILPVRAQPGSRTLLAAGEQGVPLLLFANRGLGRIGAWSSDLTGGWGAAWRQDQHFPARLAQWLEFLAPSMPGDWQAELPLQLEVRAAGPLTAEAEALAALAGGPLRSPESFSPQTPVVTSRPRLLAAPWAFALVWALLALLLWENLLLRLGIPT